MRINIGISSSWETLWEPNGSFCSIVLLLPVLINLVPSSSRGWAVSNEGYSTAVWVPHVSLFIAVPYSTQAVSGQGSKRLELPKGQSLLWMTWTLWGSLDRVWKEIQQKAHWAGSAYRQITAKGKLDGGQPRGGRQLQDMESECAGSREQRFPGAMPNAPVMQKILIWFEMLGFATLLLKHTLSGLLFSSPPS